jgi:mono/diheme cytochrome c family protein
MPFNRKHVSRAARSAPFLLAALASFPLPSVAGDTSGDRARERGRYLVTIGGCNDCHTPGYPEQAGKVPVNEWLTGSVVGFQGPWGTTYPTNLRLLAQSLTEAQWIARLRTPMRPPMPWFNTAAMSDADLSAMYRFVRGLGPNGAAAPIYAAPGVAVDTPFIVFVPQQKAAQAALR